MDFEEALRLLRRGSETLPEQIAGMAHGLEDWSAERVLKSAAAAIPHLVVTSSFGADSLVLLHLVHRVARDVPVMFLDTGFHFAETLQHRQEVEKALGLRVIDIRPEPWVQRQAERYGTELPMRDADACCRLRKTLPLQEALRGVDGWVTGVRRSATPERAQTPIVEARRQNGAWILKIAPIARWTEDDVEQYIATHDLPRHPLIAQGYRSIGCAPCTRAVADGEDARAGRWSAIPGKTECGIHLPDESP